MGYNKGGADTFLRVQVNPGSLVNDGNREFHPRILLHYPNEHAAATSEPSVSRQVPLNRQPTSFHHLRQKFPVIFPNPSAPHIQSNYPM